jgi:hypothetical protein
MLTVYVKYDVNISNGIFWIRKIIIFFSLNVITALFMQQYGPSVFISMLSHYFIGIFNMEYNQSVVVDAIANLVLFCNIMVDE